MIFVTGGTGFLGTHLLRRLALGNEKVCALKRKDSKVLLEGELKDRIEWREGDVLDIDSLDDAMQGCTKVYHCAAVVSYESKDRNEVMKVNINGTGNVVNAALSNNVKKLVHVSSVAAIGKAGSGNVINEKGVWIDSKQNSAYALSKHLAEVEVFRGIAEGLNAVIVNPSLILGQGDWKKGTPNFFLKIWKGFPFYSSGETGMVAVDDVVKTMILLMESEFTDERFIISGADMSYKDLLWTIAESINRKRPRIHASPWMMQILWRIESLRSMILPFRSLITRETAFVATKKFQFDNSKIRNATGFQFSSVRGCIAETGKLFLKDVEAGKVM